MALRLLSMARIWGRGPEGWRTEGTLGIKWDGCALDPSLGSWPIIHLSWQRSLGGRLSRNRNTVTGDVRALRGPEGADAVMMESREGGSLVLTWGLICIHASGTACQARPAEGLFVWQPWEELRKVFRRLGPGLWTPGLDLFMAGRGAKTTSVGRLSEEAWELSRCG